VLDEEFITRHWSRMQASDADLAYNTLLCSNWLLECYYPSGLAQFYVTVISIDNHQFNHSQQIIHNLDKSLQRITINY
jgi:hypothetical protein